MPDSSLTLICGDEPFLIEKSAREWRTRAASSQVDVEIFDQPSKLELLAQSLAEMPLFDPERAVVIKDPPQLSGRGNSDGLIAAIQQRAPTTAVCIVNRSPLTPTHPLRKAISDEGGTVIEHIKLRGRDLRAFVEREASQRGLRLTSRSVDHMLATVGSDMGSLIAELDKLHSFANGTAISHDDVVTLTSGDGTVETWNVIEWLLSNSPGRGAAALLALLAEGRAPQYLLMTLAGQIRELVTARALLSEEKLSPAQIASRLKLQPWRADKLVRQAKQVPGRVSVAWLRELHRIDAASKAGDADDAESLRLFALRAAADVVHLRTRTTA